MSQHNGIDRSREMLNRIHDLEAGLPFASKRTSIEHSASAPLSGSVLFSFLTVAGSNGVAAPTATMTPGNVRLGPDTLIEWASFTGESTTVTPTASNTTWYVWLVVDVAAETVTWNEGATVTALNSTEKLTKVNKELVKLTLTWTADPTPLGTITEVKHLQLGDVFIPRAAG